MLKHLGSNGTEVNQLTAPAVIADHSSIDVDRPGAAGNNEDEKENEHVPLRNLHSTYSRRSSFHSNFMMDEDVGMGGLVFENIEFEVGRGSHSKKILHKISGQVKPGHTLALMGPSGAG
jgi:ABC-type multidrug transport system fused ATPase/permease subunit